MSDDTPTPIPPPSTQKTSAVPLKKETVRITLRARPAAGVTQVREATSPVTPVSAAPKKATAPIQLPSAPLPPPAPKSSTAPVVLPPAPMPPPSAQLTPPSVGLPAPTAPRPMAPPAPRPPGAPTVPGAPSVSAAPAAPSAPMAPRPAAPAIPGAAPRVETGAATSPLAGGAELPSATVRMKLPTQGGVAAPRPAPRAVGAGGTGTLPKATVKLQQGPGVGRPGMPTPSAAPAKRVSQQDSEEFYDEKDPEAGLVPLSVVCVVLGVVLLLIQMMATDTVMSTPANQPSALMVPEATRVDWETQDATGAWKSSFDRVLPQIPQ